MSSDAPQAIQGRPLLGGRAEGQVLLIREGLSFAMGVDVTSGEIIDVHSPAHGELVTGRVLVMSGGRGSSSASTAFAEAVRLGTGPAAVVLSEVDEILAAGALVARSLYEHTCPIVVVDAAELDGIRDMHRVVVEPDGRILVA